MEDPPQQQDFVPAVDGILLNNSGFSRLLNTKNTQHLSNYARKVKSSCKVGAEPHNARKKVNFFSTSVAGERDAALHACRRGVQEHGLSRQHLPGRNSSESTTIVNVTQSQSCRLAVICGPLLPIPIHPVRLEILGCFSSTLRLREIRQKFVFLPKRCHSKGAPVFRAALRGRGLKRRRGPEVMAGQ